MKLDCIQLVSSCNFRFCRGKCFHVIYYGFPHYGNQTLQHIASTSGDFLDGFGSP